MAAPTATPGVYASLDDLIALQRRARGFSFLPHQPVHSVLTGRHASRLRGRGLNFEEIRRYFPGDDVRQIDWKATLRTGHTQYRVYTEERERTVLLVVDQRRSMFFGSVRNMKSVTAAETAALAAWRVLDQGDRIGAIVFNDTEIVSIRPQRSRRTVMQILHAILKQNRALSWQDVTPSDPGRLALALEQAVQVAKHDCLVCLITDGHGQSPGTNEAVSRLAQHNDVVIGFVHDPLEAELPAHGRLVLSDGGKELEIDTDNTRLRSTFQRTFAEKVRAVREFMLQREVPILPLSTAEDVVDQLRRSLGAQRK